jgi:TatD DNase family protein
VVAIGEIGLDYFREGSTRLAQLEILGEQLALACERCLPVLLHLREERDEEVGQASFDLLKILKGWVEGLRSRQDPLAERPGVLHSFSGSLATAREALALGFFIGVTGPVTFKNAGARRELVAAMPLDRILIETDAPYLTPAPHRGQRNEPAFVKYIAEKIAQIQSRGPEEIADMTTANAKRLFSWVARV